MSEAQISGVKADLQPAKTKFKNLWVATVLTLLFGGLAGFYFGVRRGLETTLAWLYLLLAISIAHYDAAAAICLGLVHLAFALAAYRYCRGRNTALEAKGSLVAERTKSMPWWEEVLRYCGKIAAILALGVCLTLLTYMVDLAIAGRRYVALGKSLTSGMTIEEVLNKLQEPGSVHGLPPANDKNEIDDIILYGPEKGLYLEAWKWQKWLTATEAASLLRANMPPGKDYQISLTYTPFYGPHWSLTVQFDAEHRVKRVLPLRPWD